MTATTTPAVLTLVVPAGMETPGCSTDGEDIPAIVRLASEIPLPPVSTDEEQQLRDPLSSTASPSVVAALAQQLELEESDRGAVDSAALFGEQEDPLFGLSFTHPDSG